MDPNVSGNSKVKCNRSWVWHHFKKSEISGAAVCNYCKEKVKTIGDSTACLRDHFIKYHRKPVIDLQSLKKVTKFNPRKVSTTWVNLSSFQVPKKHEDNVDEDASNNKTGNTDTSLKMQIEDSDMPKIHVEKTFVDTLESDSISDDRKVEIREDSEYLDIQLESENSESHTNFPKRCSSFVWFHFHKTNVPNTAMCNYCLKVIKTNGGNTSSLRYHFIKYHKDEMNGEGDYENSNTDSNDNDSAVPDDTTCAVKDVPLEESSTKKTRKRVASRSLVWDHFKKATGESKTAVCIYCDEECRTSGNTTNLMLHLARHHSKMIALDDEGKSDSESPTPDKRYKSVVWKHFTKSEENKAVCKYCSVEYSNTHGNTAHLKSHLIKCHPDYIAEDVGDLMAPTTKTRKPRSIVWYHFEKSDIPNVAICLHCNLSFNTSGNTSNLRDHLVRKHKDELIYDSTSPKRVISSEEQLLTDEIALAVSSLDEGLLQEKTETHKATPTKRSRSLVWEHFEKSDEPNKATCFHCYKSFNTSGNTSNLKDHLFRKHREVLETIGDLSASEDSLKTTEISIYHEVKPKKQTRSFVWNHFEKSEPRKAICIHCTVELNTCGNTSHLRNHLLRRHMDKVMEDSAADIDFGKCTPKRQSKSFVWNHFKKSNPVGKAVCNYCSVKLSTCGNTTNLRKHLVRCQAFTEYLETFPADSENVSKAEDGVSQSEDQSETKFLVVEDDVTADAKAALEKEDTSLVWNHFKKGETPKSAICLLCNEEYEDSGSTTDLWNHLITHHKEYVLPEGEDVASSFPIACKKKSKSLIWKHFEHDRELQSALCLHCGQIFKFSGTTTNLWNHLRRMHKEQIRTEDEDEEKTTIEFSVTDNKKSAAISGRSIVWDHFIRLTGDKPSRVICIHCGGNYNSSGNTTNLWNHLYRNHRKMVVMPQDGECSLLEGNQGNANQIEILEEDAESLSEDEREVKKDRSAIWKHYKKNEGLQKVECAYCDQKYSTSGSTVDLWKHLVRCHRQIILEPERIRLEVETDEGRMLRSSKRKRDSSLELSEDEAKHSITIYCEKEGKTFDDIDLQNHLMKHHQALGGTDGAKDPSSKKNSRKSLEESNNWEESVQKHFKKIVTPQFAICDLCGTWCESGEGGASNLRTHLTRYHKAEMKKEHVGSTSDVSVDASHPLWNHFKKSDIPQFAACNRCDKLCKITEDLMLHLATCRDKIEPPSCSPRGARPKSSFVWKHFRQIRGELAAVCRHCDKSIRTYGNTTNARKHLVTHHKDAVVGDGFINFKSKVKEGGRGIYLHDFLDPDEVLSAESPANRQSSSLVWQHFAKTQLKDYVVCDHCKRLCRYYGNTTNLRSHLARHHKEVVERFVDDDSEEAGNDERAVGDECEGRTSKDATDSALDDEYVILVVSDE